MNLICDAVILAVIVLMAFIGRKKGFVLTFFNFFGSIIAFVISSVFVRPFALLLKNGIFTPLFSKYVDSVISENLSSSVNTVDFSSLPAPVLDMFAKFGRSAGDVEAFVHESIVENTEEALQKTIHFVVDPIAENISFALAFFLLFVFSMIVIRILSRVFDLIAKLPVLHFSNKLLGLVCGFVWGLFIAFILTQLLVLSEGALQSSENAMLSSFSIDKTILIKFLNDFNPIRFFIKSH